MSAEKPVELELQANQMLALTIGSGRFSVRLTPADIDKALESLNMIAMSKALRDQTVAKLAELKEECDTAHALLRSVRSALIGEVSFIPNSLTRDNLRRLIEELRHV